MAVATNSLCSSPIEVQLGSLDLAAIFLDKLFERGLAVI
jgi:hypothetical protein